MALFLRQQGYRAFALEGGYLAWKAEGYPTVPKQVEVEDTLTGVCPACQMAMSAHKT